MTKWVFYVLVLVYMCYRAVYGGKVDKSIAVELIDYGEVGFLEVGARKTINCKGSIRNQRLEWVDPFGNEIKRTPSSRVFAQEHFVTNPKASRNSALVLTITELLVSDSGIYECRSGDQKKSVPICVIRPSVFVNTLTEVSVEAGRSFTLTCQANGDPEPRLVWNRNGHELIEGDDASSKYKVNRKFNSQGYESQLTIFSVEPEDSGIYECVSVQESPMLDDCIHSDSYNVTLQVNHAPIFKGGNDVKLVFGEINDVVDLKCEASGWPQPTYRWFKELSDDALYEFDKSKIKFTEDPNVAVLSVKAGTTTFDKFYKCVANNKFGDAEKHFKIVKTEKPSKASDVSTLSISGTNVSFSVTWDSKIEFPIKNFDIQYIEASQVRPKGNSDRKLKENDWMDANLVHKEFNQDEEDDEDIAVKLEDLNPNTEYIVRMRATNEAGEAAWSAPVWVTTLDEIFEEKSTTEDNKATTEETTDDPLVAASVYSDNGTFYGIFFTGGILIVAVVCMFAMRLV